MGRAAESARVRAKVCLAHLCRIQSLPPSPEEHLRVVGEEEAFQPSARSVGTPQFPCGPPVPPASSVPCWHQPCPATILRPALRSRPHSPPGET